MSSLPEALRPWAAQLSVFPEELALSVGAHVARLAAAIGSMRARNEVVGGEPQGYDGLTRRGSPERLLISEWLMALEVPDEFVRRAAFGEQAYLQPAFRQPQGGRRTVALLDAGPDQFGSPRIAHLAVLVVLARRAEAAGAGFAWVVLQSSPQTVPFSSVDAGAVGRWLKAVNAAPVTDAQLAAWREALEWGSSPDDVWLVGGPRLSRLQGSERLSRVVVDEVVVPGARQLSVEVRPASRPSRQVVLELPPEPQCVRLLRDPFETATAAPVVDASVSPVRALRFSADGQRLLLAHEDGSVAAQALPQSPRATTPKPRRFFPVRDEALAAVGWRRDGGLIAVTLRERTLRVYGSLKGYRGGRAVVFPIPDGVETPRLRQRANQSPLLAMSQRHDGHEFVLLLDAEGTLYELHANAPREHCVSITARGVTALVERKGGLFYVSHRAPGPVFYEAEAALVPEGGDAVRLGCRASGTSWQRPLDVGGDGAAFFGHMKGMAADAVGPVVARLRPGNWRVLQVMRLGEQIVRSQMTELYPRVEERVVGLVPALPGASGGPGLVVLGEDARSFSAVFEGRALEPLVSAPARVVSACVSPGQPMLAWLTETGEVGVWSFQFRAVVFRALPGGTP